MQGLLLETEDERGASGIYVGPVRGCAGFCWATAMQFHAEDDGVRASRGRRKGSMSARPTRAGPQGLLGYEGGEE